MKAEELMIGDIVMLNPDLKDFYEFAGKPCIVIGLNDDDGAIKIEYDQGKWFWTDAEDDVEGIKITPEILEKNGFYFGHTAQQEDFASQCPLPDPMWTFDEGSGSIQISLPNESDGGEIILSDQNFDRDLHFAFAENIYVHELQHALKLCGIEKEIKAVIEGWEEGGDQ